MKKKSQCLSGRHTRKVNPQTGNPRTRSAILNGDQAILQAILTRRSSPPDWQLPVTTGLLV
jgi:hypothetical protein